MKFILFTGACGFLGSSAMPLLTGKYHVDTLDFSDTSTYSVNLAIQTPVLNKQYDIVLHAAGKAHSVAKSPKEIQAFYDVNYQGTKNLCSGLEKTGLPGSFVFISTLDVYGCETGELITETHPLNAVHPYGNSKIQAEEYLLEWCERKNVLLTIIRPSLLAGKNPPGNLGAMIKGIKSGKYVSIAGGKARKSFAMASDIGRLIPYCEEKSGIFNLCDDHNPTFRELEELISKQVNKSLPVNIPMWSAKCLAKFGDLLGLSIINADKLAKITQTITYSNEKIKKELNFIPSDVLAIFLI
jgi:nucleoside-diphosphate-sugar epimerase